MTLLRTKVAGLSLTVAVMFLSACGGGNDTEKVAETPVETQAQASLIGRFAVGVSEGTSEITAFHQASTSVFITVDTSTVPTSFQRISLRNLSSTRTGQSNDRQQLGKRCHHPSSHRCQRCQLHCKRCADLGHQRQLIGHCRQSHAQNQQRCGGFLQAGQPRQRHLSEKSHRWQLA